MSKIDVLVSKEAYDELVNLGIDVEKECLKGVEKSLTESEKENFEGVNLLIDKEKK